MVYLVCQDAYHRPKNHRRVNQPPFPAAADIPPSANPLLLKGSKIERRQRNAGSIPDKKAREATFSSRFLDRRQYSSTLTRGEEMPGRRGGSPCRRVYTRGEYYKSAAVMKEKVHRAPPFEKQPTLATSAGTILPPLSSPPPSTLRQPRRDESTYLWRVLDAPEDFGCMPTNK